MRALRSAQGRRTKHFRLYRRKPMIAGAWGLGLRDAHVVS